MPAQNEMNPSSRTPPGYDHPCGARVGDEAEQREPVDHGTTREMADALELVFDTVTSSSNYPNLRADPRIALVHDCASSRAWRYSRSQASRSESSQTR